MQLSFENIALHLPRYLSAHRREGIKRALADLPEIKFFYLNAYPDEVLQGDCWTSLTALDFRNGNRKGIRGVVLSNSCEIVPGRGGLLPPQLIFVPLLRLEVLRGVFERHGKSPEQTDSILDSVRRQEVDNFIYFPKGGAVDSESAAWLDQIHTMPFDTFLADSEPKKLGTLTDASFYVFAFKMSVYFCRLHEDVDRSEAMHR